MKDKEIELMVKGQHQQFRFSYGICENPDCDCNGANIFLEDNTKTVRFFLDFATESDQYNQNAEERIVIKSFLDFIKKDEHINLKFFKDKYSFVKNRVKRKRDAIESFQLGTFMTYRDIIWKEDDISMAFDGKKYTLLDGYCVIPKCSCQEVALYLFEDIQKEGVMEADFSFVYDYNSGRFRDLVGIDKDKVKVIIKSFLSTLDSEFKRKHLLIKENIKEELQQKIVDWGFKEFKDRKLGRNELCYCGSNKKYKKCCLNDDIKKFGGARKVKHD